MKSNFSVIRRGQRVIRMVSELHRMGYQRLRVMPYVHPLAWRLAIAPADCFNMVNGIVIGDDRFAEAAVYSSASSNAYFEWSDASNDDATQLAEKFADRFPRVVNGGAGRDWAYAGWLAELLGVLRTGDYLPVIFESEYMGFAAPGVRSLPLWVCGEHAMSPSEREFDLPPRVGKALARGSEPELVLRGGGIFVRLLSAVAGFERKHGYWPFALQAPADTIATLATHVLSPEGFGVLQSKLTLEVVSDGIVACGHASDRFAYSSEGWHGDSTGLDKAGTWLGLPT